MKVVRPVNPLQDVPEKGGDVVDVQRRIVFLRHDQQILGERHLPLTENRIGTREDFLRPARPGIGHVTLAGDREQERVDPGRIDGVDGVDAGDDRRHDRPGQLMDQRAERGVLLRRPADRRERPDGPRAMKDPIDSQHGKIMSQTVIAEMVSKWSLGLLEAGHDGAGDHEIGLGGHWREPVGGDHREASAAKYAGEAELGQPFRQGHHGRDRQRRRPSHEDIHAQGLATTDRRRVVNADPSMDLVMKADLGVRDVFVAGELDPIHPQVRSRQAGPVGVLRVHLRQRDKRPAVHRPRDDLREPIHGRRVRQDRPRANAPGEQLPGRRGDASIPPGMPRERRGVDLQFDQSADGVEGVPEQEAGTLDRAEQVADGREGRSLEPSKQDRRPLRLINPALDGGGLKARVDLGVDRDEPLMPFQVGETGGEIAITHQRRLVSSIRFGAVIRLEKA